MKSIECQMVATLLPKFYYYTNESTNGVQAIPLYRSYHILNKMKVTSWYKSGSLNALRLFCIQNQDKPISVKLTNRSDSVEGALHSYCIQPSGEAHLYLLLTDVVGHPAYYGFECIESLHIGRGN